MYMKLQIMSDLHLEFPGSKYKYLENAGADILVLAGDITSLENIDAARNEIGWFCSNWDKVVYVPGNHEFYGTSPTIALANLRILEQEHPNLNCIITKIHTTTLWFGDDPSVTDRHKRSLNDFKKISDFEPWVYEENTQARLILRREVQIGDIIVTHHAPSYMSVPTKYSGSILNRFFVSDCEDIIEAHQPSLWIHGHMHDSTDYLIHNTRVVCNPKGYPHEPNYKFDSSLVISI
jgi:Icc-related predicted phosphoesterase